MPRFVLSNIARFLLLLLAVSFVAFALVSASPIDPVQMNVGQAAYINMSEAKRAQLAEYWGVGTPLLERYADWLGAFLHGDMGTSLRFNAPVSQVLANRALNSLALMACAWVLSGILGFAMGVTAGAARGSAWDRFVKGYCFVLASTPAFWLGLLMLIVFSVWLGWFPFGFSVPIGVSAADVTLADVASHMVLPALTLSVVGVANVALHTREKTIDVMESPYARFARTRGLGTWQVIRRHGLRNVALPALTLQFASISEIFGGSVLVEQVFSYPGLGQAAVTAGLGGDAPLLAGIAVFSAAFVFVGNLTANVLYGVVDPRIRRKSGGTDLRAAKGRRCERGANEASKSPKTPPMYDESAKARERTAVDAEFAQLAKNPSSDTCEEAVHSGRFWAFLAGFRDAFARSTGSAPTVASVRPPASVARASTAVREAASRGTLLHAPRRASANRRALLAKCVLSAAALIAVVVAGVLVYDSASVVDFASKNLAPSLAHLFGTDWMGRDMFLRTVAGLSTSILIGLLAAGASSLLALVLGVAAALGGPRIDAVVSWLIDLMLGIPHIVLLILISYALGKGFWGVVIGVALTHWPSLARVVRAEVLQCRQSDFVAAARRLGVGRVGVAVRHMLPYVLPQFLVGLILLFPHAILHEASITFLGFGLPPEMPAIGVILSESMSYLSAGMWWLAVFPGLALVGVVLLFDACGGALRRLVDPHTSQE